MNWNEYKNNVKQTDPIARDIIEEAESESAIITAIITQRKALGLSQRDLAKLCEIPQSSLARIESNKITPRIDTVFKIFKQLGLTLSVTKATPSV